MRRFTERSRKQKITLLSVSLALTLIAIVGIASIANLKSNLDNQQVRVKSYQTELKRLNTQLDTAEKQAKQDEAKDQSDKAEDQQQIQQLQQDKQDLQQQLQAKAVEKSKLTEIASAITVSAPVTAAISGCGDNTYSAYIYSHESGCNTTITNSEGCIGIGQACPASKLLAACPSLDYACENSFFSAYAVGKYGSWEAAYGFWVQNHWW